MEEKRDIFSKSKSKEFFLTIPKCFNPDFYKHLRKRKFNESMQYFTSLLFISFIIMFLLFLPKLIFLPNYLSNELDKFSYLTININQTMRKPIVITEKNPLIVIDTINNRSLGKENLLITEDNIFLKIFYKTQQYDISEYKHLLNKKEDVSSLFTILFIFMVPTLLIFIYLYFLLKYLIIVFIIAFIGFIVFKFRKTKLKFRNSLKLAIYAATVMVLIEIITAPFFINLYHIPKIVFLFYYIIALLLTAQK